jgi:hypothetical protein
LKSELVIRSLYRPNIELFDWAGGCRAEESKHFFLFLSVIFLHFIIREHLSKNVKLN